MAPTQTVVTPERLMQFTNGFQVTQMLGAAIRFGFFNQIAAGVEDAAGIAAAAGTDARATRTTLDGLCAVGLLHGSNGTYQLSDESAMFMVEGKQPYLGALMLHIIDSSYEKFGHFSETVKTGKSATRYNTVEGGQVFFGPLVRGLFDLSFMGSRNLVDHLYRNNVVKPGAHVLDIGSGSGVWSLPYLLHDKTAKVTAVDVPSIVPIVHEYAQKLGVDERVDHLAGSFFDVAYPKAAYDVAVLGNICHQESPESNLRLLRLLAAALKPGGLLVIVDMIPNADRSGPPYPLMFAINMLMMTDSGGTYTEAEYRDWFSQTGFAFLDSVAVPAQQSPVLLAHRI